MRHYFCLAVAFVLAAATSAAAADTIIGRWCNRSISGNPRSNQVLAIVATDAGKVVLISQFGDGSSGTDELRETAGGIYELVGSRSGDKYRIIPSTGNLQLLDADGFIGVATRLENTPRSRECSY